MKNAFKKIASTVGFVSLFSLGASSAHAQIPVTDIAGLVQAVTQVMTMYEQLTELQNQLSQAEKQFDSITGSRGMTELLNNKAARSFLPSDMQDILEATSGLTDKYKKGGRLLKDKAWQDAAMQAAKHLEGQESSAATDLANSEVTYKRAGERIDEYQDFVDKIDDSTDPKAIQDLQARIQSESVFLQNETVRLQSMQLAQAAKKDMQQVREKEMIVNMTGASGVDYSGVFEE
jgi:type IV secretion system protein VirB5